jgi:hypothetical protein
VDAEFYGRAGLERTMVYRDLMRPHRGRSSLIMYTEGLTLVLVLPRRLNDGDARRLIDGHHGSCTTPTTTTMAIT